MFAGEKTTKQQQQHKKTCPSLIETQSLRLPFSKGLRDSSPPKEVTPLERSNSKCPSFQEEGNFRGAALVKGGGGTFRASSLLLLTSLCGWSFVLPCRSSLSFSNWGKALSNLGYQRVRFGPVGERMCFQWREGGCRRELLPPLMMGQQRCGSGWAGHS